VGDGLLANVELIMTEYEIAQNKSIDFWLGSGG
jgi:hypothetical protein